MMRTKLAGPDALPTGDRLLTDRLDHLDLLRGMAAWLVLGGHLRGLVFQSYAELAAEQTGPLVKAFYFATGLGAHAVLAFFALSGFLVGGKALGDLLSGRFTWTGYMLRRLTRLWLVIVPLLVVTFVLDRTGLALTGGAGYDGRFYDVFNSGPKPLHGIDHGMATLLGNVAFLHTIVVPVFGSNGPMWSLTNEFWYYVVFPLAAWVGLARVSLAARISGAALLGCLLLVLPIWLWEGGLVWLAGAVAA